MCLYLDASARRRLAVAQRAMLSPLAYADTEAWALAVNHGLRDVVGADYTVAFIVDERGFGYLSDDTDPEPLRLIQNLFAGYDEAGYACFSRWDCDPQGSRYVELYHRLRRGGGSGAYHDRHPGSSLPLTRSDLFQATHIKVGHRHMMGISTPLPVGEVATLVAFESSDAEGYSDEGLELLELLAPAYEAGVRTWRRTEGFRETLDVAGEPLAVFGPEGKELFMNRALTGLLADEPAACVVIAAMKSLARNHNRWHPRHSRKSATAAPTDEEVVTPHGAYRMWGSALRPSVFGTEAVLVAIAPLNPTFPTKAEVRERFGLTPREAEAALLIAEGLDNRVVAERLCISPHTARRHTERVLRKLGINSRSAVAVTLLRRIES